MKKSVLLAGIVLALSMALFELAAQDKPNDMIEKFFKDFKDEGPAVAIDNLYASNPWMSRAPDAVTNLKSQLEGLDEEYVGKYYGYEPIVEKQLTQSYRLSSFLVKYDRQPVRFSFTFYKPDGEWRIHSFKFDGNLDDELEESAKLYFLELNKL